MKFLPLVWSALWRKRARSIFTLISITVAFLFVIASAMEATGVFNVLTTLLVGGKRGSLKPTLTRLLIPMAGLVRSLNVSVATALLLFEAFRQRQAVDHSVHPWTTGEYPHRPTDEARPDGTHRFA